MSAEHGHSYIHSGHQEERGEPQPGELHLAPVRDDVGQVGGDERVHSATGPGKVDLGVGEGHQ